MPWLSAPVMNALVLVQAVAVETSPQNPPKIVRESILLADIPGFGSAGTGVIS